MAKVTELVAKLAAPAVEAAGCELWDVEYVREAGVWYLRLYIDKAGGKLLEVLKRYTFRASLSSLLPRDGISMGWQDDLTTAVAWEEDSSRFFYFGENGKMISPGGWGYDIYHCDPALFGELAEIVQTYGVLEETRG